ncbi:DNA polymerase IV [[Eubacterium] hominis]|uniref:Y-family DNA polymerase n=1 Tax=[Eubacterium] hominis TaxID=2764325 RepID=UPI0022E6E4E4
MERIILHSDINHCYAQIEEMKNPHLRHIPMAVGGFEEKRHGIILAKNDLEKTFHIKTGESLREAYAKCPQLTIIHPHYEEYLYYTEQIKDVYRQFSDRVESFGLDEAWVDVSESSRLYGDGVSIARMIQKKVLQQYGITISIGVSFNKIFAKLGSDMVKHMGLVEITKANYKQMVWPLPVSELLYIGRSTASKLEACGIHTIGELASLPSGFMSEHFGKVGEILHTFANGWDETPVAKTTEQAPIKSIGNAITAVKDIVSFEEAKLIYYVLTESVASRLRESGLKGNVIHLSLRNMDLISFTRQKTIIQPTNLCEEIMPVVLDLLKKHYDFQIPLRTIGVSISGLRKDDGYIQMNLFTSEKQREKQLVLEETMDAIRNKFGFEKIQRCSMKLDQKLTDFDPKHDHIIHPVSFF